tara:strand:+ start:981 stop:1562 length:582 start_codon:yes stop_codon:yes gene_type:complete
MKMKLKKSKKEYDRERHLKLKDQRKEDYLENREQKIKYQKMYNLKNKEQRRKSQKMYYTENIIYYKDYFKQYRSLPENKKQAAERDKKRKQNDPNYKLLCNLRSRLWQALKGKNKSASTMELIGCSIDELWIHLKSKFKSWMTKENYGLWHVDHIIPCAKFDLTCPEQQKICFHWSNLQPLKAIDNLKKGVRC